MPIDLSFTREDQERYMKWAYGKWYWDHVVMGKTTVRKQDMIAAGDKCLYCGIRVDSGHPETDCPYSGYNHDNDEIWATTNWHPGNYHNHYRTYESLI